MKSAAASKALMVFFAVSSVGAGAADPESTGASRATVEDLQQKVETMSKQLDELKAQLLELKSQNAPPAAQAAPATPAAPQAAQAKAEPSAQAPTA